MSRLELFVTAIVIIGWAAETPARVAPDRAVTLTSAQITATSIANRRLPWDFFMDLLIFNLLGNNIIPSRTFLIVTTCSRQVSTRWAAHARD
jgi:hypothetical protein